MLAAELRDVVAADLLYDRRGSLYSWSGGVWRGNTQGDSSDLWHDRKWITKFQDLAVERLQTYRGRHFDRHLQRRPFQHHRLAPRRSAVYRPDVMPLDRITYPGE